jgi:hypothetical protein
MEVCGDDVDLAQAFQWLQEKTLFAAGAILWNPAPGVEFAACDLVRNALISSFLHRSLADQEAAYREVWLDPLQRRIRGGGGPAAFDGLLKAFLEAEGERRAAETAAAAAAAAAAMATAARDEKRGRIGGARGVKMHRCGLAAVAVVAAAGASVAGTASGAVDIPAGAGAGAGSSSHGTVDVGSAPTTQLTMARTSSDWSVDASPASRSQSAVPTGTAGTGKGDVGRSASVGSRHVSATERDLTAMLESDQVRLPPSS